METTDTHPQNEIDTTHKREQETNDFKENETQDQEEEEEEENRQLAGIQKFRKSTMVRKAIWMLLLIPTIIGTIYHVYTGLEKYLSYPVAPIILKDHESFKLPSILICNINIAKGYKMGILSQNPLWTYMTDGYENNLKQFWNYVVKGSLNEYSKDNKRIYDFFMIRSFLPHYAKPYNLSLGPEDSVLLCLFDWKICDFRNFTVIYHGEKGACFLYEQPDDVLFSNTGVGHGLTLFFHLDDFVAYTHSNRSAVFDIDGIHIYTFPHRHWLPPELEPEIAQRKSIASYTLGSSTYERLSTPVYECLPSIKVVRGQLSRFGEILWREYYLDNSICRNDYYQSMLINRCGCFAYDYLLKKEHVESGIPYCLDVPSEVVRAKALNQYGNNTVFVSDLFSDKINSLDDIVDLSIVKQRMYCFYTIYDEIKAMKRNPCPSYCKKVTITKSYDKFLLFDQIQNFYREIYDAWGETRQAYISTGMPLDSYNHYYHMYKVSEAMTIAGGVFQINPSMLKSDFSYEVRRYELINFFADLGGTLGLWIGVSILTVLEIIDAIVTLIQRKQSGPEKT